MEVFGPDGERLDSAFSSGSTHVFNVDPIPAAGTYTIVVRPTSTATGSATVTVSLRDDAGALVLDGAATEFVVGRAGQEVAGTLDLSAGQDVALSWTVENLGNRYVELFDPDGTRLASRFTSGASGSLSEAAVPVSGTYTVLVRPMTPSTGTVSVSATEPADALVQRGVTRASVKDARPEPELEDADDSSTSALPEGVKPQWTPDAANLQGVDWVTRRDEADVPRNLRAARGTTAVAGHVLDLKGKPLAGVTVTAGDVSTRSDKKGRFLLEDVSAAAPMIVVDGSSANTNKAAYGTFRIQVEVEPGTTTQLPATVWMPRLDTEHTVELEVPTTTETVLTSPYIPGLEVRLPAGTVVRDADGNVVRELGITPLPLDRAPFPMPRYGDIPLYFTVQPGGTFVFPEGAQIVYPNYTGLAPGERVEFFDYEPEGEGWRKYGHGTVSEDGTQVVPDEDTRVWSFDGSSFNWSGSEKPGQSRFSDFFDWLSGDPVDLSTGLLTDTRTDLAVDDGIAPIAVERSYWQGDQASREFGIGQHLNYGMWLHSEEYWQEVDLYLPGGGKVHYVRTTPGNSLNETEMEAVDTTGPFRSSTISYVQGGWDLVTLDGLTYHFPHVSRATSITDRNGNEVRLTRDGGTGGGPGNDLTQITSPTGRWIKLEYDAEHRITSARDNIGRTVTYTYDEAGHLSTVTDPAGNVSTYTYDTEGRIDSITDARGITYLSNEYDANGRVSRQTLTDGQVFEFEYTLTADGTVSETRVTRPDGSVREVSFDADGVAMSDTILSGSGTERTTTFTRRADNLVTEVVDPYGRVSRHSYDERGLLESTSVLSGTADEADLGTTTYGAYTLPVEHTDPAGNVTRMRYDDRGNLVETIDPEGRSRTATYNARGQVTSVTDASGNTSEFGYVAGDLVSVTGPDGATTRMFTDAVGRRTVTEAPDGAIRTMELDELNQPVRLTDPLGFEQSYTYDPNGNVTGFTDAAGRVTSWTYDDSDRVVARTDASGASDTFAYDAAGRISETTSRAGRSVSYGYDGLGRVISEEYASGGQFASAVTYAYDEFDRPASVTDSEIGTTSYTYDVRDRVVGVDEPAGSTTFEYDANSRVVSATMAGQQARTYTYDATGALTGIDQGGTSVGLDLDAAGRLSQVSLPGGWTQSYTYDTGDRVTALTYAHGGQVQGDLAYTYLPDGKVGSVAGSYANVTLPAERSALEYDVLNRLTSAGGVPLEYDQDGNMLTDGSRTFQWDARGRLAGVAGATVATEFGYDPTGGRAARTNDGDRTGFLDLGPNTAVELDADGEVAAELLSGGMDQWFARIHEGGTDAILTDLLGSPLALGAADGTTSARYSYDPFGVTTTTGDTHGADLGFTGRQDDGTGLTYHRARYYHPELGRFISEDPIGLAGGTNLYAYAANAPTSYTDPTGTNPLLLACAGGALVDGGISYLGQRLSGRKVQWGDVGAAAATGCVGGMLLGPIGGRAIQAGRIGTAARPAANGAARGADDILDGAGALCRRPNSFDAGTLVLMADGSRKPIEDVEVGDLVLASDPVTGEQGARRVTDLIRHGGVHTMVDVGFADGGQVDATDEHPFWVVSEDAWVDAIDLEAGDLVLTAEGSTLRATSVDVSRYDVTAYNLTIADLHTYHVTADDVLVHNAGDDSPVGEVFRDGAYRFQIFSNDHAPAHGHLQGPGIKGHGIQIGQNGKPLDPNIKLTSAQQKVIDNNLRTIRNSIRNYMKWYKQNPGC
ncbi:RHS repeat-associated core domain-containing protein [Myceligenerans salitolerans]|uniref:Hint domain-containing protein n=1 Tax=Myceligenerans salitolerans TaxID=1230528 RepID=A0ABS3I9V1_9MICO|nr:RHS repeat-associated core domain-containing protein [Myceligenerans salitolerans]MBO0609208.1 hypothetical protein [Myceligenerans salitolerans]